MASQRDTRVSLSELSEVVSSTRSQQLLTTLHIFSEARMNNAVHRPLLLKVSRLQATRRALDAKWYRRNWICETCWSHKQLIFHLDAAYMYCKVQRAHRAFHAHPRPYIQSALKLLHNVPIPRHDRCPTRARFRKRSPCLMHMYAYSTSTKLGYYHMTPNFIVLLTRARKRGARQFVHVREMSVLHKVSCFQTCYSSTTLEYHCVAFRKA